MKTEIITENTTPYNITILSNTTLNLIEPHLDSLLTPHHFSSQFSYGNFDNILQECLKPTSSIINGQTNCIIISLDLAVFSPLFIKRFTNMSRDEIQNEQDRIKKYISTCVSEIRKKTDALILFFSMPLLIAPNYGIYDNTLEQGQNDIIISLNHFLKSFLLNTNAAFCIDLNLCIMKVGNDAFIDLRYFYLYQSRFSKKALQVISAEIFKYIFAFEKPCKKCLVLDCDNILWGGIVGEVGTEQIELGPEFPGVQFLDFQTTVLSLYDRGIILALCSKNNEHDVWDVFQHNKNMLLKREHVSAYAINWNNKASNLSQIANDLGINTNSMVFIDDSINEIELVNQLLPEVTTLHLPTETSFLNSTYLQQCGHFEQLKISDEDRKRGQLYAENANRRKFQAQYHDLTQYYHELEMSIEMNLASEKEINRISQLTQRTNQFNLTSRRYNESQIANYLSDKQHDIIYIKLHDKFGDMGIIGLAILVYSPLDSSATIDTFLLSCRALGRNIEVILLNGCKARAKMKRTTILYASYIPTPANKQTENFYQDQNFTLSHEESEEQAYYMHVDDHSITWPSYFQISSDFLTESLQKDRE